MVAHEGLWQKEVALGLPTASTSRVWMRRDSTARRVSYKFDRSLAERIWRRVSPRLAPMRAPNSLLAEIEGAVRESEAAAIFLV